MHPMKPTYTPYEILNPQSFIPELIQECVAQVIRRQMQSNVKGLRSRMRCAAR